jgi:hypothetical protein
MVKRGFAPKHHGHDKRALKLQAAEEKENLARQQELAGPDADALAAERRAARRTKSK